MFCDADGIVPALTALKGSGCSKGRRALLQSVVDALCTKRAGRDAGGSLPLPPTCRFLSAPPSPSLTPIKISSILSNTSGDHVSRIALILCIILDKREDLFSFDSTLKDNLISTLGGPPDITDLEGIYETTDLYVVAMVETALQQLQVLPQDVDAAKRKIQRSYETPYIVHNNSNTTCPSLTNFETSETTLITISSQFSSREVLLFQPADYEGKDKMCVSGIPILASDLQGRQGSYGVRPHHGKTVPRTEAPLCHIGEGCIRFGVLLATLQRAGVRLAAKQTNATLLWMKRVKPTEYKSSGKSSRINHIPGTWGIGRKDSLARAVATFSKKHDLNFHPKTFILPGDSLKLRVHFEANPQEVLIVKPCAAACGQGIFLLDRAKFREEEKMADKHRERGLSTEEEQTSNFLTQSCIAQCYLPKPFLIGGRKVDFRCYVVVSSVLPLRIFFYKEGMVRFATEEYQGGNVDIANTFAHLTNYSINKTSDKYKSGDIAEDDDDDDNDTSSKWTFTQFREHCGQKGIDVAAIEAQFHDIAVKTLLSIEPTLVTNTRTQVGGTENKCFQIFGVDLLLDSSLKAHLLEFNIMPSVNTVSPLDSQIKCNFLADLLTLIGVSPISQPTSSRFGGKGKGKNSTNLQNLQNLQNLSNLANLANLTESSSSETTPAQQMWDALNESEKGILIDAEDEVSRRGHFARIFPDIKKDYTALCEPRPQNLLLSRWEAAKRGTWDAVCGVVPPPPPPPPPQRRMARTATHRPPQRTVAATVGADTVPLRRGVPPSVKRRAHSLVPGKGVVRAVVPCSVAADPRRPLSNERGLGGGGGGGGVLRRGRKGVGVLRPVPLRDVARDVAVAPNIVNSPVGVRVSARV